MLRIIPVNKHSFKEKCDFCSKFSYEYEGTEDGKVICKECKIKQEKSK